MREIVIDTETTGLDYKTGDRIIEVGCVELKTMFLQETHSVLLQDNYKRRGKKYRGSFR